LLVATLGWLLAVTGCITNTGRVLRLESLYAPDGGLAERIPDDYGWDNTPLPTRLLDDAGVKDHGREPPDPIKVALKEPGIEARKMLGGLAEADLDPFRRGRAVAVLSLVAEKDPVPLHRALALSVLSDLVSIASDPVLHAGGPSEEVEEKKLLETLSEGLARGTGDDAVLEAIGRVGEPSTRGAEASRIELVLVCELARNGRNRFIRRAARRALPALIGRQCGESLVHGLEDASDLVREDACRALARCDATWATLMLVSRLESDTSPDVRRAAAVALGQLRSVQALEPLIHALERPGERRMVILCCLESLRSIARGDAGGTAADWNRWLRFRQRGDATDEQLSPGGVP
jgi:HEAT repeat protein